MSCRGVSVRTRAAHESDALHDKQPMSLPSGDGQQCKEDGGDELHGEEYDYYLIGNRCWIFVASWCVSISKSSTLVETGE